MKLHNIPVMVFFFAIVAVSSMGSIVAQEGNNYRYAYVVQEFGQNPILNLVDSVTGTLMERVLPVDIAVYDTVPSPDGNWIAVLPVTTITPQVELMLLYHVPSDTIRTITVDMGLRREGHPPYLGRLTRVAWSSDNQHIAYINRVNGISDVYIYTLATQNTINLTNDAKRQGTLEWGTDNNTLVVASEECDFFGCDIAIDFYDQQLNQRTFTMLVPEKRGSIAEGGFCNLELSPDMTYLVFVRFCQPNPYQTMKEAYIGNINTRSITQLTSLTEIGVPIPNAPQGDTGWRFAVYEPFWLDNQLLALGTAAPGNQPVSTNPVTTIYDISQSTQATLLTNEMAQSWAYNSVSQEVAYLVTNGYFSITQAEVRISSLQNGSFSNSQSYPAGCNLTWSPDGNVLAYTQHSDLSRGCVSEPNSIYFVDRSRNTEANAAIVSSQIIEPVGWVTVGDQISVTPTPVEPPSPTGTFDMRAQISGPDNNQQSQFRYLLTNTSDTAQSDLSVRLYFSDPNGMSYALDEYYDSSNALTITGPNQLSGDLHYFTLDYGMSAPAAGATIEFNGALRLADWSQNHSSSDDFWRTGLTTAYSPTLYLPVYQNGALAQGQEPDGTPPLN